MSVQLVSQHHFTNPHQRPLNPSLELQLSLSVEYSLDNSSPMGCIVSGIMVLELCTFKTKLHSELKHDGLKQVQSMSAKAIFRCGIVSLVCFIMVAFEITEFYI